METIISSGKSEGIKGVVAPIANAVRPIRSDSPIAGAMRAKISALGSTYVDTFDYSVYDRIHKRYGEDGIRGGMFFKSPWKLVNSHTTCRQCHYSFEVDVYGRGCTHNCTYCYAKEQLSRYGYWNRPTPVPLDISEVRKLFWTVFESDKKSEWREILERRIPVRIGSMSDSFMWIDKKYGITKEFLKILRHYRYPYVVFTRSDLVADREYIDVMDPELASIQASISSINDDLNRKVEPGAPSAKRRLEAMRTLSDMGFNTAVRINPLFPMHPDGYFSDPDFNRTSAPHLDYFSWDLLNAIADHRIKTVIAGVVRLSPVALKQFSLATGVDYSTFFKPNLMKLRGDKRFSDDEVGYYYREIHRRCRDLEVAFTTCYIGNGEKDYFQYQSLWNDKGDCCNIKTSLPAFKTTCQSIPLSVRQKHAPQSAKASVDAPIDNLIPSDWTQ